MSGTALDLDRERDVLLAIAHVLGRPVHGDAETRSMARALMLGEVESHVKHLARLMGHEDVADRLGGDARAERMRLYLPDSDPVARSVVRESQEVGHGA